MNWLFWGVRGVEVESGAVTFDLIRRCFTKFIYFNPLILVAEVDTGLVSGTRFLLWDFILDPKAMW